MAPATDAQIAKAVLDTGVTGADAVNLTTIGIGQKWDMPRDQALILEGQAGAGMVTIPALAAMYSPFTGRAKTALSGDSRYKTGGTQQYPEQGFSNAKDAAVKAVKDTTGATGIDQFLSTLSQQTTWVTVGKVVLGLAIIVAGTVALLKPTAGMAASITPIGKLGKMVK